VLSTAEAPSEGAVSPGEVSRPPPAQLAFCLSFPELSSSVSSSPPSGAWLSSGRNGRVTACLGHLLSPLAQGWGVGEDTRGVHSM
jgi:hypothetical protein